MIDLFTFQLSSNELIADLQPLRSATKYDHDYIDVLAAILLKHFSHVVEVESYLESYRKQYRENLLKIISVHTNSDNFASLSHLQLPEDFKKKAAKRLKIKPLELRHVKFYPPNWRDDNDEFIVLLEGPPKPIPNIDNFVTLLGGHKLFFKVIHMYTGGHYHYQSIHLIKPDYPDRELFVSLTLAGVIARGDKIKAIDMLKVLPIKILRSIALKSLGKTLRSTEQGILMLGALPNLMDYIKMEIDVDDVFQLPSNPLSTDMGTIFKAFLYYLKIAQFMSPPFPETFK